MRRRQTLWIGLSACLAGCAGPSPAPDRAGWVRQVTDAELAFAKTMADRDHAAFLSFVAEEAVFLNGGKPLRGKAAIGDFWKRLYTAPTAPFSWKPDLVEVLPSGTLAQSIGPVFAPGGKLVGRFYSTWRLDADGRWRVIFDDGYDVCDCGKAP
ncbi:MAG: nuclear transport factor 2 family protein [Chitinophagaceae bacterium]|nr:nuclear transport factor 2 family protein [Rubrivivax sp.]